MHVRISCSREHARDDLRLPLVRQAWHVPFSLWLLSSAIYLVFATRSCFGRRAGASSNKALPEPVFPSAHAHTNPHTHPRAQLGRPLYVAHPPLYCPSFSIHPFLLSTPNTLSPHTTFFFSHSPTNLPTCRVRVLLSPAPVPAFPSARRSRSSHRGRPSRICAPRFGPSPPALACPSPDTDAGRLASPGGEFEIFASRAKWANNLRATGRPPPPGRPRLLLLPIQLRSTSANSSGGPRRCPRGR
jgi:hypothetical protein